MLFELGFVEDVVSVTGMGFTWYEGGNLLYWDNGVDDWTYRYDLENRLINVKKNDALSAVYNYDADGRRVRSWDSVGGTTDYVYSGLNIIDEINSGTHEKHVYAGGLHLASNSSGVVEYYHQDHLGSTRLKTNSTGGVVYESNYEPYGPGYDESGSEEFRYTGKQEDPTGLYYYGARYYDPATGRFTTRDKVFGDLADPQSLNRYSYCRNNPHKYTDPDGRWSLQIGYGGSAGWLFGGISSTIGVALGSDPSGEQNIIAYSEIGTGPQIGAGLSTSPEIAISPFGDISDVGGDSFTVGIDASFIITGLGLGISIPIKEDNSLDWIKFSVVVNPPWANFGVEVKMYARPTYTVSSYSDNQKPEAIDNIEEPTSITILKNNEKTTPTPHRYNRR